MYTTAWRAAKRPGYPSGQWHPPAEVLEETRGRLMYLWRQRQVRASVVVAVAFLLGFLLRIVPFRSGSTGANVVSFLSAFFSVSNALLLVGVGIALNWSISKLVHSGRPVEGLVVGVSDDGIDRLYTLYYEDEAKPFEVQFTVKTGAPTGRFGTKDSVTLILGPSRAIGSQRVIVSLPTRDRKSPNS